MSQDYFFLNEFKREFEMCLKFVPRLLKNVSWVFQGCLVLQVSFKVISGKCNSVLPVCLRCFNEVPRVFENSFKEVFFVHFVSWQSLQLPEQKEVLFDQTPKQNANPLL